MKAKIFTVNYCEAFQTFLLTEKRLSRNSVSAYMTDVRQLQDFLACDGIALEAATSEQIKQYIRHLHMQKAQPRTIARKISAFKVLYGFLADVYGFINGAESLVMPKIDKSLPVYLTHDEIKLLINTALKDESVKGRRNTMMLQLLYATGLRITELVSLRRENIRFDTGFLNVLGKGGRQRDIPLPLSVCEQLQHYINDIVPQIVIHASSANSAKAILFPTVKNGVVGSITRQSFWIILKKLLKSAGIAKAVSPHTLRHSLATHLLQAGANIRSLQLWLGHEQMSTVEIYTHLDTRMVRKSYDKKHPRA